MMVKRDGRCLCGAVTMTAEAMGTMQACHCDMCRKWGGGPFMAAPCTTASFDGPVQRFASSDHAERGFCATCGTHLFFNVKGTDLYGVPVGMFDDASDLPFKAEIFVDERPETYAFAGERKQMTGPEFMAKFRGG